MLQKSLLELAREGNPKAISALLNHNLQKYKIIAKVDVKGSQLKVLFEADQVPSQEKMYAFMQKGMESLKPEVITKVSLYGKAFDQDIHEWEKSFEIQSSLESQILLAQEVASKIRDIAKARTASVEVECESQFLPTQKIENPEANNSAYCPNCGSSHLQLRRDTNVSWGRAAVGWALFGAIGGAVGAVTGEDRNAIACLNCGTTWRAKDLYRTREVIQELTGKTLNLSKESDRIYINCFLSEIGPYLENLEKAKRTGDELIKEKEIELEKDHTEGIANGCSWSIALAVMGVLTIASGGLLLIPIAISLPFILPALGKRKDKANRESREKQIDIAKEKAKRLSDSAEKELRLKVLDFTSTRNS
jgi:hypothetical protein